MSSGCGNKNSGRSARVKYLASKIRKRNAEASTKTAAFFTRKRKKKTKRVAKAIGYGLGATALAGAGLSLRHKGVRAHLKAKLKSLTADKQARAAAAMNMSSTEVPQFARDHISEVMETLKKQGYSPADLAKMKIGVVGTGGTGKSSLALALKEYAPELEHLNLDSGISSRLGRLGTTDTAHAVQQQGGLRPGTVADQVQLLHGTDPGQYDLLIKVKRDAGDIKKSLYDRGHYGFVGDYTDINKAQTLVDDAFNMSGGQQFNINKNIDISLNPSTVKSTQQRMDAARDMGLDMDRFKNLTQRDQLVSLSEGKISAGKSWRSRISSGKLERDAATAGLVGVGGGYYGSRDDSKSKRKKLKLR